MNIRILVVMIAVKLAHLVPLGGKSNCAFLTEALFWARVDELMSGSFLRMVDAEVLLRFVLQFEFWLEAMDSYIFPLVLVFD